MFKTAYLGYKDAVAATRASGTEAEVAAAKERAKVAMRQLIGIAGSSLLLAGVQGLPMFGAVMVVANMFLDDDEDDAETIVRKYIGEGWYKGPTTQYTGVDVANRIGLSNLFFRMNPYNKDMSVADYAWAIGLGPAGSIAKQQYRGAKQLLEGEDVYRGIETLVPAAVRNGMKILRWGYFDEGAIKSRRGDIIVDDISAGDLASQLFGFAPVSYTLQQEKNLSTKRIDRATNKRRTRILRQFYIARRMGDTHGVREAFEKLNRFNRDHPSYSVKTSTIIKSMRKHAETSAEMVGGITMSPRMKRELLEHQREYWGDD